jgi:GT2 family glycosyltransferase/glycosyltransferase involved in cell wall biosynthesis
MKKRPSVSKAPPESESVSGIDVLHSATGRKVPKVPEVQHDFRGNLDSCGPTHLSGWLFDQEHPDTRLEVEVRADGIPVARGNADLFRMDLLEGNVGDGICGFRMALPEVLFDGKAHEIEVREAATGFLLPGSPQVLAASAPMAGEIKFEQGLLVGTARWKDAQGEIPLNVIDLQTGKVVSAGTAQPDPAAPNLVRFSLPLPAEMFDGRPHAFSVRGRDEPKLLHDIALITPYIGTPESVLLQYAREGLSPSVSAAAGFRYESLAGAVEKLGQSAADAVPAGQLDQLARVHQQLVRGFSERDKVFAPLVFPRHDSPDVSIVIPAHNKFHVTYHCLASLLLAPTDATFEVVLVDDGSSDMTADVEKIVTGIRVHRNEKAKGFIRACNAGGSLARGRYIVMLNNDTEVTAHWLDELLWPFHHFGNVGMTGAKLLYADGTLQEAGGVVWNTGNPWNYGRNANARDPRFNYARETDYLSGACLLLPTALWKEIGGFSEAYLPAYFEDTDLAFQVRSRGLKTVYTPTAQVFHFEGMSNGTDVSSGTKRYQEINRPKFKARWNAAFRDNGPEGVDLELNKDRNVHMRALVIDAQMPMPDQDAGGYAAVQEMRMLQALGFKCTFIPQNLAWMGRYTVDLQRAGIECLYAPFFTSMEQALEQRGKEFDLVYITRYYVAQSYIDMIRRLAPRAKIVLMNADLHFLRELRAAIQAKNPEMISKSVQTREQELAVMRSVDLVLSYTDVEKAVILSHNLDSTKVEKCPWVDEARSEVPGFAQRRDIAFLGGFNHLPNVQAVEWFVGNVMPLLREKLPDAKFLVYGSRMPTELSDMLEGQPGVEVRGWVASVRDVYDTCRVFVAPLLSGAGIKGKVIGALANGVPTVMSDVASEGIGVNDGVDGYIASTPQEWAAAIVGLYRDENAWRQSSRASLELARKQFGFEQGVRQMRDALQAIEVFTDPERAALVAHD